MAFCISKMGPGKAIMQSFAGDPRLLRGSDTKSSEEPCLRGVDTSKRGSSFCSTYPDTL